MKRIRNRTDHSPKLKLIFILTSFLFLTCSVITFLKPLFFSKVSELREPFQTSSLDHELITIKYEVYRLEDLVNREFESMTEEEKVGQMFMFSIPSTYIDSNTKKLIDTYHIGGLIIMSNNISSKQQLIQLIEEIQNLSLTNLLIATDQEGGVVARIPWDKAGSISQPHIGIINRLDFAYSTGAEHAQTLKDSHINMNLAPVLDTTFNYNSPMQSRVLGTNTKKVSTLGIEIIKAHKDLNVIATAKHFPGIGRTSTDSHEKLPIIDISRDQLFQEDIIPFKEAINADIDVVMMGHVKYPQVDPEYPSSLSSIFTQDILRKDLGFDGVVISDDLSMGALNDYPNKVIHAINSGTDMLLLTGSFNNQVEYINKVLEALQNSEIDEQRIVDSIKRILRLKYQYGIIE